MIVIRVAQRTKPVAPQSNIHYTGVSSSTSSLIDSAADAGASGFSSNEPVSLYETSLQASSSVGQSPIVSEVLTTSTQNSALVYEASQSELVSSSVQGSFS